MSEKVTFRELIESIAEETDHSKQFTHDFLKDFVDVINGGLESEGKVNIAGLGKFDVQHVDEREGYNPQKEEKVTIPAHNKLVFKPYKEVRELVNKPYAHLESELIEQDDKDSSDETGHKEEDSPKNNAIPTGLPPSRGSERTSEGENVDPFEFLEEENSPSSNFSLDNESEEQKNKEEDVDKAEEFEEDIVEFRRDSSKDSEETEEAELTDFGPTKTSDQNDEAEDSQEQTTLENEDSMVSPYAPDLEGSKQDSKESIKGETESDDQKSSSLPILAAAAGTILLLAIGAWYFTTSTQEAPPKLTAEQSVSTSQKSAVDQQGTQQDVASNNSQTSSAQKSSQQPQQTSQTTQSANQQEENLSIEEGQTLWSIAEEKYGNPRLWPWIYDNNGSVKNPDLIIAGNSLSLPLPSGPQNNLTTRDSVGVAKGYLSTYRWYKDKESPKAKNHLWGAKHFHEKALNIADIKIDEADLSYAKKAR